MNSYESWMNQWTLFFSMENENDEHLPCQGWAPFNQGLSEWNISADFAPHEHHVCRHVAAQDSLVMTRQCLLPVAALVLCLSLLSITWTSPYGEVKILYQKFRSSTLTSSNSSSTKKSDQFLNFSTKKSDQFLSPPSDPGNAACVSPSAAFCIAGLARSFFLPAVHLSQKRNLVDAFGAKRSDVFLLLKLGNPEAKADGWYSPADQDELRDAVEVMSPRRVRYVSYEEQQHSEELNNSKDQADCRPHIYQQQAVKTACWKMVLEEERSFGNGTCRYDYVFFVRPDLAWTRPWPPIAYFEGSGRWQGATIIRDWMQMIPRALAPRFFQHLYCSNHITHGAEGETVMAQAFKEAAMKVRFQCMEGDCNHDMHQSWVQAPSYWQRWRCLQPCHVVRVVWDPKLAALKELVQWGCAVPMGWNFSQCQLLTDLPPAAVTAHVEVWHARKICGGHCHEVVRRHSSEPGKATKLRLRSCDAAENASRHRLR